MTALKSSSSRLGLELRQHGFAEEAGLLLSVVAPDLQHDVGAAGLAILLDALSSTRRAYRRWGKPS